MSDDKSTQGNAERRQQILEAALKVFSTKGFHKATNKDIAQAAGGISPGLIYWYFKDKEDLFASLVRERAHVLQLADRSEEFMSLPPREAFYLLGQAYLSIFHNPGNMAFFRIMISEASRFPKMGEMFYRGVGRKMFGLVNGYLQHQVELGVLRPHDTAVASRSFVGMFIVQLLARNVLMQPEAQGLSDEQILSTVIDLFLHGLEKPQA